MVFDTKIRTIGKENRFFEEYTDIKLFKTTYGPDTNRPSNTRTVRIIYGQLGTLNGHLSCSKTGGTSLLFKLNISLKKLKKSKKIYKIYKNLYI
jgi:hypothetical protein